MSYLHPIIYYFRKSIWKSLLTHQRLILVKTDFSVDYFVWISVDFM